MTNAIDILNNAVAGYSPSATANSAPIAKTADPELAQTAVELAANASAISSFGNAGSALHVYDAAGILNSIAQAGSTPSTATPTSSSNTDAQTENQQSLAQGVISTPASDPTTSGIYNSSGTTQNDSSADWATLLKSNPNLSSTVIADSYAQGIIGLLAIA